MSKMQAKVEYYYQLIIKNKKIWHKGQISLFLPKNLERKIIRWRISSSIWLFNSSASDTIEVSSWLISRFICSSIQMNSNQISSIYIWKKVDLVSEEIYSDRTLEFSISVFF